MILSQVLAAGQPPMDEDCVKLSFLDGCEGTYHVGLLVEKEMLFGFQ